MCFTARFDYAQKECPALLLARCAWSIFLAQCTRNQLIRQIEFLKVKNEILRKRLIKHHIVVGPENRQRLVKLGTAIGPDVKRLITIVRYDT